MCFIAAHSTAHSIQCMVKYLNTIDVLLLFNDGFETKQWTHSFAYIIICLFSLNVATLTNTIKVFLNFIVGNWNSDKIHASDAWGCDNYSCPYFAIIEF